MVEIIPKKPVRELPIQNALLYVPAILLIGVILAYAVLLRLDSAARLTREDLEGEILKIGTQQERQIEQKVINYAKKINTYAELAQNFRKTSQFLNNFENLVHPRVLFTSFTLDAGQRQAKLKGQTDNFQVLEQQLLFLRNQKDFIESVGLTDIALDNEGRAIFSLDLTIKEPVFNIKQ